MSWFPERLVAFQKGLFSMELHSERTEMKRITWSSSGPLGVQFDVKHSRH
jgi:hypothetical protein